MQEIDNIEVQEKENSQIAEENKSDDLPEIESEDTNESEDSAEEGDGSEEDQQGQDDKENKRHLFNNLRRENYRYATKIAELENRLLAEREEMERLRYLNDLSTQTALSHYEEAAKERLDRARQMREAALESGDVKAISETDIALMKAVSEYEKLRGYKAEQDFQFENEQAQAQLRMNQQAQQQQQSQYPFLSQENYVASGEWFDNNEWFNASSQNFNSQKYALANQLIQNLDSYCIQNGMENLIGSRQYFNTLDKQIEAYSRPQHNQRQNSSSHRSVVAPARGGSVPTHSGGGAQRQNREAPLSDEQRNMIKSLGVTEQEFKKGLNWHKKNDYFSEQMLQQKGRR